MFRGTLGVESKAVSDVKNEKSKENDTKTVFCGQGNSGKNLENTFGYKGSVNNSKV